MFCFGRHAQANKENSILSFLRSLSPFPQVFRQVKKWLMLELNKISRLSHFFPCPIVFISLNMSEVVMEKCSKLWKKINFIVFNRLSPFLQTFRQIKGWLMLKLHKIINVSHVVTCRILFILFYNRGWQGGLIIT